VWFPCRKVPPEGQDAVTALLDGWETSQLG